MSSGPAAGAGLGTCHRRVLQIEDVRFSQASIFPTITNGTSMVDFYKMLTATGWNDSFEPPRVVCMQGKESSVFVAFDNRRTVTLRWMAGAGLKETASFNVFDSGEPLLDEERKADIGLQYSKFVVDISEEELAETASSLGIEPSRLASRRSFELGDRPETWGDVLLARTSAQRKWGAPTFPLLGQGGLPWVKWDIMQPYIQHCKRLRALPKDHPIVHFEQPRCMFDRRTKLELVNFLKTMPAEEGELQVLNGEPEFSPEWRRFLANIHSWCDDVLEGNVHCVMFWWRPSAMHLGTLQDGRGRLKAKDLSFSAGRVDLIADLVWHDGAVVELAIPVAERGSEPSSSREGTPATPEHDSCNEPLDMTASFTSQLLFSVGS